MRCIKKKIKYLFVGGFVGLVGGFVNKWKVVSVIECKNNVKIDVKKY